MLNTAIARMTRWSGTTINALLLLAPERCERPGPAGNNSTPGVWDLGAETLYCEAQTTRPNQFAEGLSSWRRADGETESECRSCLSSWRRADGGGGGDGGGGARQ
jgi:uncharacterized membrane protein YgcG